MKRTRKIISIILALIMMLCMSPLSGLTAVMSFAASVTEDIAGNMSDVIFDVPETIYLKPETSSTASVFQYYADRGFGDDGLLRTGENTTGNIYFKCSDATSVGSVTCRTVSSTGSVTGDITSRISLNTSGSGSNTRSITIASGSLQNPISAGSYQTLRWTITYVKDGKTCTATNYSVCYSPLTWAAATATSAGFNGNGLTGSDFFVRQTTWIAGVHSVKQATEGDWQGSYSITSPLTNPTAYYHQTSDEPYVLFLNNTGIGAGGYCKRDEDVHYSVGVGYLTVDTSRYSTLNSIPNLQCGMDFNGLGTDKLSKNYQIALYIGAYASNQTEQNGNIAVFPTVCEEADYINNSTNLNYIGRHGGYKLNFSTSVTDLIVRSEAYGYDLERGRSSVGYVHLNTTRVDKSTLRGMIGYAVAQGYQASDYTSESWASYELQLQKACEKLGQVTNTDISTTALDNAISGLELNNSGEPSRSFTIMFNMNGGTGSLAGMQATTGSELRLPNYRPEREGSDFFGWATAPNAQVASFAANQLLTAAEVSALCPAEGSSVTLYAIWGTLPTSFLINFDMNGGTGSFGNITATFGSQLRLPSYRPERSGYNFMGWSTDQNAVNVQFSANQLLTAAEVNALRPANGSSNVTLYAVWGKAGNAIIDAAAAYNTANSLNNYTTGTLGGTVTGGGAYSASGQQVTLTAAPATGYKFEGWFENNQNRIGPSSNTTYTFSLPTLQDGQNIVINITARFCVDVECYDITTYYVSDESPTLKYYSFGGSGGTITSGGKYMANRQVTLNASASLGYYFDGWYSGSRSSFNGVDPVSTNSSYTFTVTEDAEFTARFSVSSLTICERCNMPDNLTEWVQGKNGNSGGTVAWRGTPGKYGQGGGGPSAGSTSYYTCVGGTMTITAAAYAGYSFVGWYSSMAGWDTNSTDYLITTDNDYTFVMPAGNPVFYARFDMNLPEALYKTIGEIPEVITCFTDESVDELQAVLDEIDAGTEGLTDEQLGNLIARLQEAVDNLEVRTHEVNVPANCTSTQADVDGVNYKLATITAPATNANGDKFVYWTDSYGNIVSTYRTYKFYVGNDADYTPVYASAANYDKMKADALITSRVLDVRNNGNGNLVFLAEHSVGSSTELNGHGMIITTNENLANDDSLIRGSDNDDIIDFQAQTTKNSKTGMIQVCATVSADTVWARTYVVDAEGEVHYGQIQSYNVANLMSGDSVLADSVEFDAANEEIPVEEEQAEGSEGIITMLLNIIKTLIQKFEVILKGVLSLLK